MHTQLSTDEQTVTTAEKNVPSVSIILPFDIKISAKSEAAVKLKIVVENVEKELRQNYPAEEAGPVLIKLQNLLDEIDFSLCKKSIAIFISPLVEKIFYLTMPVEEKIVIDESFDIRDLVYNKKFTIQYLALLISAEESKIYWNNGLSLAKLKMDVPVDVHAYAKETPEKMSNFSDPMKYREILLETMLHHTDDGLSHILHTHPYPVFVLGADRDLGHFKKITKNEKSIVHFIHGNFISAPVYEIQQALKPFVEGLEKTFQQHLVHKLGEASRSNRLACGIDDVWAAANRGGIRLLVVEKDFIYPGYCDGDIVYPQEAGITKGRHTKDAVSDILQKVLETGGDVEFTDDGLLTDYERIAAIKYY